MNPTHVYDLLSAGMDPVFRDCDYEQSHGWRGSLVWTRNRGAITFIFNCQIHKDGYLAPLGCKFTLRAAIGQSPQYKESLAGNRFPASVLMNDGQRSQAYVIQQAIIERILSQRKLEPVPRAILESQRKLLSVEQERLFQPEDEIAFRYVASSDIENWAEFLRQSLPGVIEALEKRACGLTMPEV